jgi:hypothetical protein
VLRVRNTAMNWPSSGLGRGRNYCLNACALYCG